MLLGRLQASAPARIINVSSRAHEWARRIEFEALRLPTRSRSGMPEYGVSKLCNILFTRELARRLSDSGVTTYAVHPGVVATEMWRYLPGALLWRMAKPFMSSAERGARTALACATTAERGAETGRYYGPNQREAKPSKVAQDDALAARLWAESDRMVGLA